VSHLDKFLETPPAALVDDLKDLRTQKAAIESREKVIEQLLEMIVSQGGPVADEVAALGASVAIGPLREQIRQVLLSRQDENEYFMVPQEVQKELMTRGNRSVTLDHVRTTMKRMADSDELLRPQPNAVLYALPNIVNMPGVMEAFSAVIGGQST
jgi:hypothetical protein